MNFSRLIPLCVGNGYPLYTKNRDSQQFRKFITRNGLTDEIYELAKLMSSVNNLEIGLGK